MCCPKKCFMLAGKGVNEGVFRLPGRREKLAVRDDLMVQTQLSENVFIDPTKDAVVIDGVSKVFKKPRPLFRGLFNKKEVDEKKREVRAVDDVSLTIKRREIVEIGRAHV